MSGARTGRLLTYEGRIATWLLAIWQSFLASASFVATAAPLIAFQALVGWQPTHTAIALFGVALLPLVPGGTALLVATADVLDHGGMAHAGPVFWRAFRRDARRLSGVSLAIVAVAVVLSYDFALLPSGDATVALVVLAGVALVATATAVCVAAADSDERGVALVAAACRAAVRRPHLVLCWLLLMALGVLSTTVPVLGPNLMIFAPALVALRVHVCNRALGLTVAHGKPETT